MECNKEEAVRAKCIAEKKMQLKDFLGARKIALKAQQLFPELENIAQMLTVCEVHCAEAIKVNNQEDWYGILQVEPTADENFIKKQYRRLAFLLHPDKNKFEGAESAFKLVGEAQRVLLDKAKRSVYDLKRRTNARAPGTMPTPPGPSPSPYATAHTNVTNQQQKQSQTSTFWTFCPFCAMRYQYYRSTMSRAVRCQNCTKTFMAYDMNAPPTHVHSNFTEKQSGVFQGNEFSSATNFKTTQPPTMGFQGTTAPGPWSRSRVNNDLGGASGRSSNSNNQSHADSKVEKQVKFEKVKLEKVNSKPQAARFSGNVKRKRAKKHTCVSDDEESSSSSSDSTNDMSDDEEGSLCNSIGSDKDFADQTNGSANVDTSGKQSPRRSTRQKQNVTYTEDKSDDDDFVDPQKRFKSDLGSGSKKGISFNESTQMNMKSGTNKVEDVLDVSDGTSNSQEHTGDFCYPDPEFYDFNKDRDPTCFEVGQIWALYDDLDGMPRFYVRISHIIKINFHIRFSWLLHAPQDPKERKWSAVDLPVACGNFTVGQPETTKNLPMFSHIVSFEHNKRKSKFYVQPIRGQIWALYKEWDIEWSSNSKKPKHFDYEIAEILSENTETIDVAPLIKLKGFVSLFTRGSDAVMLHIPRTHILKFSHMIPSHKMSGDEREGVPKGSYELDPAALPSDFEKKFPSAAVEDVCGKATDHGMDMSSNNEKTSNFKKSYSYMKTRTQNSGVENSEHDQSGSKSAPSESKWGHAGNNFTDINASSSSYKKKTDSKQKELGSCGGTRANERFPNGNESHPFLEPKIEAGFHNFESERSIDKIAKGQVWACYSEFDGFPKNYVLVKEVKARVLKVQITRLEPCLSSDWQREWYRKNLPVACGQFKPLGKGCTEMLHSASFSHYVKEIGKSKNLNWYAIYPSAGEVWALYRNWSAEWVVSDIKNCLYDLVEVISFNGTTVTVNVLEKREGYRSVFGPKGDNCQSFRLEIPSKELSRFSHRIPSFRITEGLNSQLSGYWDLDHLSVPRTSLHPNCA